MCVRKPQCNLQMCTSEFTKRFALWKLTFVNSRSHRYTCFRIVQLSFERNALVRGISRLEHVVGKTNYRNFSKLGNSRHCCIANQSVPSAGEWQHCARLLRTEIEANNAKAWLVAGRYGIPQGSVLRSIYSSTTYQM